MRTIKMFLVLTVIAFAQITFGQGVGQTRCDDPIKISVSQVTSSSMQLQWQAGNANNFIVEVGEPGFTPGQGNQIAREIVKGTIYEVTFSAINDLSSNTTYMVYIKSICEDTNNYWVGPIKVRTLHGFSTTR